MADDNNSENNESGIDQDYYQRLILITNKPTQQMKLLECLSIFNKAL